MKILAVKPELCNGCGACEEICAKTFFKVTDRNKSTIRVAKIAEGKYRVDFCDQCGECIAVCPTQALYRIKNGIVRIREKDCVGCVACIGFCPTFVMYAVPDDIVPIKCIACGKCVDVCPTNALFMTEVEIPAPVTEITRSIRVKTGAGSHGN
ncbi:MAG: 4Fe-4S dicluster domain-containing protein [Chloroflexota bacterium]